MGLLNKLLKKRKKEIKSAKDEMAEVEVVNKVEKTDEEEKNKPVVKKSKKKTKTEDKKKTTKKSTSKKSKRLPLSSQAYEILISPLVTEKSAMAASMNKYSFIVARWASKLQIKKAVQEIYGVKPVSVKTVNIAGRRVRFKRLWGRRRDYKKAIVTLAKGKSIDIHQGV